MTYTGPHDQLYQVVLSDTLNEWREKTNRHVDILNQVKVYDIEHADGITYERVGGTLVMEIAPYISKGITIGGDLQVDGNLLFTGTAAQFDVSTLTVDDHQIELGASGPGNIAGGYDAVVDDGGIVLLSLDGSKKWTWRNDFGNHKAWVSSEHIGITSGKAFVSQDDTIRFNEASNNPDSLFMEFGNDSAGNKSIDLSYAIGGTGSIYGNGTATGGIRFRNDGGVEILNGVTRKIIEQVTHGFVHGDVVRFDGTSYVKAIANSEINAEALGVVDRYSYSNSDRFVLVTHGEIQGFSGGAENDAPSLVAGEVHFLSPDDEGKLVQNRPNNKGQVVKPMLIALSDSVGYVVNYIGGLVPDEDIVANSIPEVYRYVGDGSTTIFGLSGSASTVAGTHLVSINGAMQLAENDGAVGSGVGVTFGYDAGVGATGPADFRIVEGPGDFSFGNGNQIEFIEPPYTGAEIVIVNQSITTPFEAVKEVYLRSTGATEPRKIVDRLGDYVSVKDYGAVGDGVIDDTAAIQSAIDQTAENANQNKRDIFFPSGKYIISSTLNLNHTGIRMYGEGWEDSNIWFTGTTGPMLQAGYPSNEPGGNYVQDIVLNRIGFVIDSAGGASAGTILDLSRIHHATIDKVYTAFMVGGASSTVPVVGSNSIKIDGWHTHRITDCALQDAQKAIIITDTNTYQGIRGRNVLIEGNQIASLESTVSADPDTVGISIECGTTGCEQTTIQNNLIVNCNYGVSVAGNNENINISQNTFSSNWSGSDTDRPECGITADGLTTNLILMGNTGSLYGNTGAAFGGDESKWQNRIELENGSVSGVNIPKVVALFDGDGDLIGGTGPGATGTNYNVSSVLWNSTGNYTISFAEDLPTTHYSIQGFAGGTAAFVYGYDLSSINKSSCRVYAKHVDGYATDPSYISVTII